MGLWLGETCFREHNEWGQSKENNGCHNGSPWFRVERNARCPSGVLCLVINHSVCHNSKGLANIATANPGWLWLVWPSVCAWPLCSLGLANLPSQEQTLLHWGMHKRKWGWIRDNEGYYHWKGLLSGHILTLSLSIVDKNCCMRGIHFTKVYILTTHQEPSSTSHVLLQC